MRSSCYLFAVLVLLSVVKHSPMAAASLSSTSYYDSFAYYPATPVDLTNKTVFAATSPSMRAGAAYGLHGGRYMYIIGGVNASQPLSDILVLDTEVDPDALYRCNATLPTPIYYAAFDYADDDGLLYVFSGISSAPNAALQYSTSFLYLNISVAPSVPCPFTVVNNITLSRVVTGRQWATALEISEALVVFGGVNQLTGIPLTDMFVSIALPTALSPAGVVTSLSQSPASNFPLARIDAVLMLDSEEDIVFVYSGYITVGVWDESDVVYRYDVVHDTWLIPVPPLMSWTSSISSLEGVVIYPDLVWGARTRTADKLHYFAIGGSFNNQSTNVIVHIDLSTEPSLGVPTIDILYSTLPLLVQSAAAGINSEGAIFIFSGMTVASSNASSFVNNLWEFTPPSIVQTNMPDVYTAYEAMDTTTLMSSRSTATPGAREGAVYGNDQQFIYVAGGAILSANSIIAYSDIFMIDTINDQYIYTNVGLPSPVYYAAGGYCAALSSLFIWGGRTNTVMTSSAYNTALYVVNFSSRTAVTVTSPTLSGMPLVGVQWSASLVVSTKLYVFGGVSGSSGRVVLPSQQWFVIDLSSYTVTALNMSGGVNFPSNTWISPAMMNFQQAIFIYSGLASDWQTLQSPYAMYVYNITTNQWLSPIVPLLSPYSALPSQLPNILFSARSSTTSPADWLFFGGSDGTASPYEPGTHNKIFHIAFNNTSSKQISAIITVMAVRLEDDIQSSVVGCTNANAECVIFGGADYVNTLSSYPFLTQPAVQEFYLPITVNTSTSIVQLTTYITSTTSLSSGAVAAIVLSFIFSITAIAVLVYVVWRLSKERTSTISSVKLNQLRAESIPVVEDDDEQQDDDDDKQQIKSV